MIKLPPSFTTDPDPSSDNTQTTICTKYFEDTNSIQNERPSSQQSDFRIKSEPDCNPYQHLQTTIPPGKHRRRLEASNDIVGSKLFDDIQRPLDSSGELAQRLDQLSKIVSHLVVNIQDNTTGLKVLTDTLLQPAKVTGELIKGQKFPISDMDELRALEEKLRVESDFRSDLVSFLSPQREFVLISAIFRFIVFATNASMPTTH